MHRTKLIPLLVGVTLLTAACADDPLPTAPAGEPAAAASAMESSEETALKELTRIVALALRDEGLRQRVKNDMRGSRFTVEHKLELAPYLQGNSGGILMAKMAKESGKSRDELQALVSSVRALEFYMPVAAHRESWRGESELLVASNLRDGDHPVVYSLDGVELPFSGAAAPLTPTFVLVPVETDFTAPLDAKRYRNERDNGGESIGTLYIICEPMLMSMEPIDDCGGGGGGGGGDGGGGGGGGGTVSYPGLYMTGNYLNELGEDWLRGKPELEVHIMGRRIDLPATTLTSISCAGETKSYPAYFNQDGHSFSGRVRIWAGDALETYQRAYPTGEYQILIIEDDNGSCQIKTDRDLRRLVEILSFNGQAAVKGIRALSTPTCAIFQTYCLISAGIQIVGFAVHMASWLTSADDVVGMATIPNNAQVSGTWTETIMDGNSYRGWATFQVQP